MRFSQPTKLSAAGAPTGGPGPLRLVPLVPRASELHGNRRGGGSCGSRSRSPLGPRPEVRGPSVGCLLSLEFQRLGDRRGGCTTVGVRLSDLNFVDLSCYGCSWCMSGEMPRAVVLPRDWTGSSGMDRPATAGVAAGFAPCFHDGGPYFPVRADCTLPCWMPRVLRGSARAFDEHCCSCEDRNGRLGEPG